MQILRWNSGGFLLRTAGLVALMASLGLAQQTTQPSAAPGDPSQDAVAKLRQAVLEGPEGQMSIRQLVDAASIAQGETLEKTYLALCLRKAEAIEPIKETLRTGSPYEKRAMTKVLRYLGWKELVPVLTQIVGADAEHPLARVGSLYALGAIGDKSAGPDILKVLENSTRSITEKRVAMATLARLNVRQAVKAIRPYAKDKDDLCRMFAIWALAELGDKPDSKPAWDALRSKDYEVRQVACSVLSSLADKGSVPQLKSIATTDAHAAVRSAARIATMVIENAGLTQEQKAVALESVLADSDTKLRHWAIDELDTRCGESGKKTLQHVASQGAHIAGQKAAYLLILHGPTAGGGR